MDPYGNRYGIVGQRLLSRFPSKKQKRDQHTVFCGDPYGNRYRIVVSQFLNWGAIRAPPGAGRARGASGSGRSNRGKAQARRFDRAPQQEIPDTPPGCQIQFFDSLPESKKRDQFQMFLLTRRESKHYGVAGALPGEQHATGMLY